MANSPQARKRAEQALRRRSQNLSQKSEMRTAIKKVLKSIETKEHSLAQATFKAAVKTIDILTTRGLIHVNKGARLKSRLNAKIKPLAS